MADERLLLSGARVGVLVEKRPSPLKVVGAVLGFVVVFIGGADLTMRLVSKLTAPPTSIAAESPEPQTHVPPSDVAQNQGPIIPAHLRIPLLGIEAPVEQVGVNARGAMASPSTFGSIAWYKGGAKPGEMGNAVLAGHLNNAAGTAGVFEELRKLSVGDTIEIRDQEGKTLRYIVREMSVYPEETAPREKIFAGDTLVSRLVLVTCNGAWDHEVRSYDKRLVVFAERL